MHRQHWSWLFEASRYYLRSWLAKAGAATRTGDEVVPAKLSGGTSYKHGAFVASLRIRYAQQDQLQKFNLWTG